MGPAESQAAPVSQHFGPGRHFHQCFAVENDRFANPAPAGEPDAPALLDKLGDLDGGLDAIADPHRRPEVECLGNVDGTRAGESRSDDRRDKARGVEAVGDAAAEGRAGGEMLDRKSTRLNSSHT